MKKQKLTKVLVDKIPFEKTGQKLYWDMELPGFGLRVGKGKKVYIVQANINNRPKRYTIGVHGVYTPETARQQGREHLLKMSKGICPEDEKKEKNKKKLTLQDIFDTFIGDKKKFLLLRP